MTFAARDFALSFTWLMGSCTLVSSDPALSNDVRSKLLGSLANRIPWHFKHSLENKATACYNLAHALLSPIDFDSSIKYSRAALAALKEGHPDHPSIITGLATGLIRWFELRRHAADLQSAIMNFQLALDLRPPGNPSRFSALSDVADALVMRYNRRVEFVDLRMAIDHYREALRLLPPSHKGEPVLLDNLGNTLFLRHARSGDLKDLDEAIEKHRLALDLRAGHPARGVLMLEALANCHNIRFKEQNTL
ncbi:hypothetical protein EV401DRAFT_2201177 [Pisolithus croceorrhizus]|nr:hypothetical protein EV401DRAFT_2201177 [Pisolithus croceorrhizus]